MKRNTQNIEDCEHCGKVFENGEDYWMDARNRCYCIDNACGWEDDETSDEALPIGDVGKRCFCGAEFDGIECNSCGFDASEVDIY